MVIPPDNTADNNNRLLQINFQYNVKSKMLTSSPKAGEGPKDITLLSATTTVAEMPQAIDRIFHPYKS